MLKFFGRLLDFIWPQFCLGCQQEGSLCCGQCRQKLRLLSPEPNPWPDESNFYFQACYVCLDYQGPLIEKLIKHFKYKYLENLADILVDILKQQASRLNLPANTIITNIPLHPKKRRQRGFDQTEVLAKKLATKLKLPYSPLLKRIKQTKTQAQLSKQDRQKNVTGVFTAQQSIQNNKTILLIDDITTTGSTLNQASKVLKKADYPKIISLVLAKN